MMVKHCNGNEKIIIKNDFFVKILKMHIMDIGHVINENLMCEYNVNKFQNY